MNRNRQPPDRMTRRSLFTRLFAGIAAARFVGCHPVPAHPEPRTPIQSNRTPTPLDRFFIQEAGRVGRDIHAHTNHNNPWTQRL